MKLTEAYFYTQATAFPVASGRKSARRRWGATNDSFDDWSSLDVSKSFAGKKQPPQTTQPMAMGRNGSISLTSAAANKPATVPRPLGQVNVNALDKRALGADEDEDDILE